MNPFLKNIKTSLKESVKVATLALAITLGVTYAYAAWVGPTSAPPDGNIGAPINVGAIDQIKDGGLGVNSLAVYGNSSVSGYMKVGETSVACGVGMEGAQKYNSSSNVIEYCNGSTWTSLSGSGGTSEYTGPLANGTHTGTQCVEAGGAVVNISPTEYVCRFNDTQNCFAGWTPYNNWSITQPNTCNGVIANLGGSACTTSSHSEFIDKAAETCTYSTCTATRYHTDRGLQCTARNDNVVCYATYISRGCY